MADIQKEEQISEARRAYYKKWRETHKEQIKEHQRRFWKKKATELEAQQSNANSQA